MRPALYVLGVAVVIGSAVGARALRAGGQQPEGVRSAAPAVPTTTKVGGPIVLGTVDSDPSPVAYGLPPVLQSGTVAKVFVKDGQEVANDVPLYEFDSSILTRDLERASLAISQAENEVAKAEENKTQHVKKIEVLQQSLDAAKTKVSTATSLYNLIKRNLEKGYELDKIDPALWKGKLDNSPELFKANADYVDAISMRDRLQAELDLLKAANVELLVKQARIAVDQAKAEKAKAETALSLCTVKSKGPGTIEQIKISPGTTLGIGTRDPALWLIPAGHRIIRAEVEADFAHRVTATLIDKEVIILDHSDPKITYTGVVKRIGGTFLPKRSESLIPSDTRVLECVVRVSDPSPAGKPPLRVGQRVRVNLGQ